MKKTPILMLVVVAMLSFGCETQKKTTDQYNQDSKQSTQTDTQENQLTTEKMQLENPEKGDQIAVLETSLGTVKVRLFPEVAPETVKNFEELIKQEKYKQVPIHRIINNFMIQMGDFENGNGTGGYSYKGPGTTVKDEPSAKLEHLYGAVSMAKTAAPNSGGSQFFIVQNKNGTPHLDGVHTVFGQVIEGVDVIEKIANVKTDSMDAPVENLYLKSASLSEYEGN